MAEHHRPDRQQREAMNIENRRAMEELARAQREAQQREHMAAEVQRVHVDREAVARDRHIAATEAAGLPHQNVTNVYNNDYSTHQHDNSTHNTSNTLHDQTVHNQMMQMVHNHSAQLGNMMHTMHLDQTQMHELLRAHLHVRSPQEPAPLENVISGGQPPPGPPPGGVGVSTSASHAAPQQPIHLAATATAAVFRHGCDRRRRRSEQAAAHTRSHGARITAAVTTAVRRRATARDHSIPCCRTAVGARGPRERRRRTASAGTSAWSSVRDCHRRRGSDSNS